MTPRLTSRMVVDALLRMTAAESGFGAVLARGDEGAGAVLVLLTERGVARRLVERNYDFAADRYQWSDVGLHDVESATRRSDYIQRRRDHDPDLWLIELDVADSERFAAEMILVC